MKARQKEIHKNWLRLLALVFSVGLWFYVLDTETKQEEKIYKLEIVPPPGLAIANHVTREVQVTLKGPQAFMRTVMDRSDKILIDLSEHRKKHGQSQFKIKLDASYVPVSFGIDVLKISPTVLPIRLEKEVTRMVQVEPQFMGKTPAKLGPLDYQLAPDSIEVKGPQSLISELTDVKTEIIDLGELTAEGKKAVRLVGLDSRLQVDTKEVALQYSFRPLAPNLNLKKVPVRFLTSKKVVAASHRHVSLLIYSRRDTKAKIRLSEVEVVADIPEGTVGKLNVPVSVKLPPDLFLLKLRPEKIFVTVK